MVGCGNKGGGTIATVNGEGISTTDYYAYLELKPDARVITESGPATLAVEGTLGFQALQDLISQQLTLQLGRDKKVFPTDADIQKEITFQKELKKDFMLQLTSRGMTLDMIRKSLAVDLIQERLITKGITITDADVEKYIKGNPDEFIEPERVELYWVLVKNSKIQNQVDQELAQGQDFSRIAAKYSEAPNAKQLNGRLIDQRTGQAPRLDGLPPQFKDMIRKMKAGEISDWVRFVDGNAKFFVEKKIASRPVAMDDTKKEYLRRILAKRKGSAARDINKEIMGKLKDSDIKIQKSSYQEPWKRALEQFKVENSLESQVGTREAQ